MVRSRRILEIIERDGLIDHAARAGNWLLGELEALADRHPELASNVRGRGLMCAFDLPDAAARDAAMRLLLEEHVLVLPCGGADDPVPAAAERHRERPRVRAGRARPRAGRSC